MNPTIYRVGRTKEYRQYYTNRLLNCIESHTDTGICVLYFCDGTQVSFQTVYDFYNTQYGIAVSERYNCIFLSDWDRGIYCYDTRTGTLRWMFRGSRYRRIFVQPDYIVAMRAGKELSKIDIQTGKLMDSARSTTLEHTFALTDRILLVDRLGRDYCLFDMQKYKVVRRYKEKQINVFQCLSYTLRDAWLDKDILYIDGFERKNDERENQEFVRIVGSIKDVLEE